MHKPIKLACDTIDRTDINSLIQWLSKDPIPQLTKGNKTVEYEKLYAEKVGRKYAIFVNSGSSANLLVMYALSLYLNESLANKKVVVPALCWNTTIAPIIQFGLTPVLCDINMNDLSVDLNHLEKVFKQENPSALFLVSILGMPPDMDNVLSLCHEYNVALFMDNCESQLSTYKGKSIEYFGIASTCSSYFGHNSSTIEGGMITTNSKEWHDKLKMLRSHGWTRDLDETTKEDFRVNNDISEFNSLYAFYEAGFNVRSTDLQAFLGIEQMKKYDQIATKRFNNFKLYNEYLQKVYWKPTVCEDSLVCNLGYPVIHPYRDKIIKELVKNNVEVRPLISGSMGTQPFWIKKYGRQELPHVSIIDKYGFYVPNNPSLTDEDIKLVCNIINKFANG